MLACRRALNALAALPGKPHGERVSDHGPARLWRTVEPCCTETGALHDIAAHSPFAGVVSLMKKRSFLIVLIFSSLVAPRAGAQQEIRPLALLGTWQTTAQHPSGAVLATTVRFTQDLKFRGSSTVNDKPFMEYWGTWSIKGNILEWRYEYSSQPTVPPGFTDTDEILSVSDAELRLLSRLSGKTHTYRRAR